MKVNWRVIWPAGSPRFLLVDCRGGLGNRLKALVAGMRAVRAMPGRILAINWEMDGYHCHCPVHLLLDNPFIVLSPAFFQTTGYIDYHHIRQDGPNFVDPQSQADVVWVTEENFFYLQGDQDVIWGQHSPHRMNNASIRQELQAHFELLKPVPAIQYAIDRFVREHMSGRHVIGVHIRRGDNVWANQFVPTELFPAMISRTICRLNADPYLLVCSDNPQAEACIASAFPDRVLTFPKRKPALSRNSSITAVEDALAEMYLLSKTELIIRTPSSTFSQCASWLGSVPTLEVGPLQHQW